MIDRRKFLGLAAGAGATLTLTPQLLRAFQTSSAQLIQRAIPSTGEMLPAVGLSFSNHPSCADHAVVSRAPHVAPPFLVIGGYQPHPAVSCNGRPTACGDGPSFRS